jgi:hypothetical protein
MNPPDMPLTVDAFLDRLDIGEYDDRLAEMQDRIEDRKAELNRRLLRSFKPGEILKFTDNAKPKYLAGKRVEFVEIVTGKRGEKMALVQTPNAPSYKRFAGLKVRVPPAILRKA